jgi:hypothetical protein
VQLCTSLAIEPVPIGPIGGLVAHRVEHRFVAVEDLLVAADPDRHLATGRTGGAPADRRIEHVEVFSAKAVLILRTIATELVDMSKKAVSGRCPRSARLPRAPPARHRPAPAAR